MTDSNYESEHLLEAKQLTPKQQELYDYFCKEWERLYVHGTGPNSSLSKLAQYKNVPLNKTKITSANNWLTAGMVTLIIFWFLLVVTIFCMPVIPGNMMPYVLLFTTPLSVFLLLLTIYVTFKETKESRFFWITIGIAMIPILINTFVALGFRAGFVPALNNMLNASLVGSIVGFGVLAIGAGFTFFSFLWFSRQESGIIAKKLSPRDELHFMVMLQIYDGLRSNYVPSPIEIYNITIQALINAETTGRDIDTKMLNIADRLATYYVDNHSGTPSDILLLSQEQLVNIIKTGRSPLQTTINASANANIDSASSGQSLSRRTVPAVLPTVEPNAVHANSNNKNLS